MMIYVCRYPYFPIELEQVYNEHTGIDSNIFWLMIEFGKDSMCVIGDEGGSWEEIRRLYPTGEIVLNQFTRLEGEPIGKFKLIPISRFPKTNLQKTAIRGRSKFLA